MKNNYLIKSSVAFIGIGQMGGNLAEEFDKLGYTTFYINSSSIDLSTINVSKNQKYQIPLAKGCAKNRNLAKQYARNQYEVIKTIIDRNLSNFSHLFICFSAGGGTGGGISPTLLANLANDKPDISFGAICALPDIKESLKIKFNACECIKELLSLKDLLGNIYFIDNNALYVDGEKRFQLSQLNNIFAESLDRLLCISSPHTESITDDQEILNLLSLSGCVTLSDILPFDFGNPDGSRVVPILPSAECSSTDNQQFAFAISSDEDFIKDEVEALFGKGIDDFKGYTDKESLVATFGLGFPIKAFKELTVQYNEDLKTVSSLKEDSDINIILEKIKDPTQATQNKANVITKANNLISELLIN